jgi:imidazolonepropionase-like amidohydrolase
VLLALLCASLTLPAAGSGAPAGGLLVAADRVFDGYRVHRGAAVLVRDGKVVAVGPPSRFRASGARVLRLRGTTVLPGVVDLHVHGDASRLLRRGVTTVRNLGEPLDDLPPPPFRPGTQRVLSAGPIVTAPGGYPIPIGGAADAYPVRGAEEARAAVAEIVGRGASLVKVALDTGPEGAYPLLTVEEVRAIVTEAHRRGRIVTAHARGAGLEVALAGGVDELAHIPCAIRTEQLAEVAARGLPVVATLHVTELVGCPGGLENARELVARGGRLLYGSDVGTRGVPAGIDVAELRLLERAGLSRLQVLQAATVKAARRLRVPRLGSLVAGAPADLIAVRGDPFRDLTSLSRVALVVTGGIVVG